MGAVRLAGSDRLTSAVTHAYSAVVAPGATLFTAGVAPLDEGGTTVAPGDVVGQVRQTLANLAVLLEEQGAGPGDVAKLTVYVAERLQVDLQVAADAVSEHFDTAPPLAVVGVTRLRYDDQVIEIEAVAAVPGVATPDA
ncbi:RidA family protein [Tsukamurella sp. 8F]|uniref:RidA family protein n=1 Tax=unclassified Tsukamurella TaxID=2633480 RepID=UPI0023BA1BB1|nr:MULTISPECIES: RidA family protein [unclassified Tsukamurella]MDF0530467.1 RidA family protein [Tsukamurella sp. 8J]MDF0587712.1 RidA family protein [Tsukamurella sp. 8F]